MDQKQNEDQKQLKWNTNINKMNLNFTDNQMQNKQQFYSSQYYRNRYSLPNMQQNLAYKQPPIMNQQLFKVNQFPIGFCVPKQKSEQIVKELDMIIKQKGNNSNSTERGQMIYQSQNYPKIGENLKTTIKRIPDHNIQGYFNQNNQNNFANVIQQQDKPANQQLKENDLIMLPPQQNSVDFSQLNYFQSKQNQNQTDIQQYGIFDDNQYFSQQFDKILPFQDSVQEISNDNESIVSKQNQTQNFNNIQSLNNHQNSDDDQQDQYQQLQNYDEKQQVDQNESQNKSSQQNDNISEHSQYYSFSIQGQIYQEQEIEQNQQQKDKFFTENKSNRINYLRQSLKNLQNRNSVLQSKHADQQQQRSLSREQKQNNKKQFSFDNYKKQTENYKIHHQLQNQQI
ncbi:hypothetical protein PPERSA_12387 [Pseudocohnilembus persalinus]|uniref:Uncharacterized protein n=1 Tax=Pseudocohnilembus persalinus TaxID=266149 RepID=A0A0V0Q8B0_PSEPJ|nr:hypothetical protein PPERSA_12387 [Pseudocohnilembus persalinus]|eukprot:KRW98430.1 hypothetical protein PPERSA_12387 [Pseudocohnilembus persalinus]